MPMSSVTQIAFLGALLSVALNALWFFARYVAVLGDILSSPLFQVIGIVPNLTLAYFFYTLLKMQSKNQPSST